MRSLQRNNLSRFVALLAAWATCLVPLLVVGDCCCLAAASKSAAVRSEQVANCCGASNALRACASDTQNSGEKTAARSSGDAQASFKSCECTLECCQPQSLVLAASDTTAPREQVIEPAELLFSVGYIDCTDLSSRDSLTWLEIPQRTITPSSYCALLCRWRH